MISQDRWKHCHKQTFRSAKALNPDLVHQIQRYTYCLERYELYFVE
jgi:hypothetical protein